MLNQHYIVESTLFQRGMAAGLFAHIRFILTPQPLLRPWAPTVVILEPGTTVAGGENLKENFIERPDWGSISRPQDYKVSTRLKDMNKLDWSLIHSIQV